ncbi:hypothetical protein F5Y17DRAFT_374007 [Xylariaceae sp. FL0594]|nr:hypothetical protein F5Y17DRAFT_374007 [Xylariaceae sp. FL0594]
MQNVLMVRWVVASTFLFILSGAAVLMRILSNRIRRAAFKVHDYLVFFALLLYLGYVIDVSFGVAYGGYGMHITEVTLDQIVYALKILWISEWLWATAICSFRLAIIFLYMDIFRTKTFHIVATCTGVVVFGYWLACILTINLLCMPIAFNWDKSLNGRCGDFFALELFSSAFNLAIDIWVIVLPVATIWNLKLSTQKKLAVIASFALGLITASINLGRLIQTLICPLADATYCVSQSSFLIIGEISGGILVACVPTLGPLVFSHRRGKSTGPYTPEQRTPGGRIIRTIGQISLRPKGYAQSDDTTLLETNSRSEGDEEFATSLAMGKANMGHRVEIRKAPSGESDSRPLPATSPYAGRGMEITKKVEYTVESV